MELNIETIKLDIIEKVEKHIRFDDFTVKKQGKKNEIAGALCEWIMIILDY